MTLPAAGASVALSRGPAAWFWPAAAAVLSAWPIWRSIAPETPDLGEGWLRLEILAGVALAILYSAWAWPRRKRIHDLAFPFWAILLALHGLVVATRAGDAAAADLCVLMIAWIVSSAIFASFTLLQVEQAGVAAGCRAPHHANVAPPLLWLGAACGIAMLVITFLAQLAPGTVLIMAVVSPGAILAWASLSETARSILSARGIHFSNAAFLIDLARARRWLLRAPTILVTDRAKLVSIHPAHDVKPGDLIGLAAAAALEEENDIGRAIQEFGVEHHIRLPVLRPTKRISAPRTARLTNGTIVELCAVDGDHDLSPFAEVIALAQSQHRTALAIVERAPIARVLGVIVFAIAARSGATEMLRRLRDRGIEIDLVAAPRDTADQLALKALRVAHGESKSDLSSDGVEIVRSAGATSDGATGLVVGFGAATARPGAGSHIMVAREDARALADLAYFAADFRRRTRIVTLLASAPGWVLIAAAFGYVPATPLLVTGVALIGIAVAAVAPQVLRLSPALDMEGAED